MSIVADYLGSMLDYLLGFKMIGLDDSLIELFLC